MPFIVKIDNYEDYRNLYGSTDFSRIGFEMLCDYHDDYDVNLDEVGKLENYFSEYPTLIDAAEEYVNSKYIEDYNNSESEHYEDEEWLLEGFREADVEVMYDYATGITVVDLR